MKDKTLLIAGLPHHVQEYLHTAGNGYQIRKADPKSPHKWRANAHIELINHWYCLMRPPYMVYVQIAQYDI